MYHPWRNFRIEIHSEPIRLVSFQSNPKKFFNPNQRTIKNQSEWIRSIRLIRIHPNLQSERIRSIRLIQIHPNLQSEWIRSIRMIPKNSVSIELIGLIRIDRVHSDCKFGWIRINRIDLIHLDWKFGLIQINQIRSDLKFGLTGFNRIHSDYKFGLILKGPRIEN